MASDLWQKKKITKKWHIFSFNFAAFSLFIFVILNLKKKNLGMAGWLSRQRCLLSIHCQFSPDPCGSREDWHQEVFLWLEIFLWKIGKLLLWGCSKITLNIIFQIVLHPREDQLGKMNSLGGERENWLFVVVTYLFPPSWAQVAVNVSSFQAAPHLWPPQAPFPSETWRLDRKLPKRPQLLANNSHHGHLLTWSVFPQKMPLCWVTY